MAVNLKDLIEEFDKESDEICDKTIYKEYRFVLNYSLLYPWLKPFNYAIARILHLIIHHIYHIVMIALCISTAYIGREDFIVAGSLINYAIITLTFEIILLQVTVQRKNMARIHRVIGHGIYNYNEEILTKEETLIKSKYESLIRLAKIIIPCLSLLGGSVLLVFGPLIDILAGVEKKIHSENGINYNLPVPFWVPYDSSGPITYWLTLALLALSVITSIFIYISFNIVYFTVCLHIASHLEILTSSVKNIERRAQKLFEQKYNINIENEFHMQGIYKDIDFMRCMEFCFKKNIEHHQVILRFHRAATEVFRNPIFTFYFLVGFMIALASYAAISVIQFLKEITVTGQPGGVLNFVDIAAVQLLNVVFTCKMGQTLIDLNVKFRMELYSTNWYLHSKTVTNLLIIVQQFTYRDLVIDAPFNFAANMNTLAGVLNTSYTYFSLILAWTS